MKIFGLRDEEALEAHLAHFKERIAAHVRHIDSLPPPQKIRVQANLEFLKAMLRFAESNRRLLQAAAAIDDDRF